MKPLEKHHLALPHAGWFLQTSPMCTKMIKFSAESMQYHTVSSSNRGWHAHPNTTPNDHQSLRHLLLKPLHLGNFSSITHVLGRQVGVAMLRSAGPSSNVCWLLLPQQQLAGPGNHTSNLAGMWNIPWMFSATCRYAHGAMAQPSAAQRGPLRGFPYFPWQGSHGQTGEGGDAELHLEISTGGVEGLRDAARWSRRAQGDGVVWEGDGTTRWRDWFNEGEKEGKLHGFLICYIDFM